MYRGTWLILALPLLVAAFSVTRPRPLDEPELPAVFDARSAVELARELGAFYPDRFPGSPGARDAARWYRNELAPYGLRTRSDRFRATIPGHGEVELENLVTVAPGRSNRSIVVMAHRDDTGEGPGTNDNGSGTAALIALARSYATPGGTRSPVLTHRILFLSSDGGAFGGLGAERFLETYDPAQIVAVVNLDSIAGEARPRIVHNGDTARSPSGELLRTAALELTEEAGRAPRRESVLGQLIDLAFPFSLYEQAPFVARGVPALTLTTAGNEPLDPVADTPGRLQRQRLAQQRLAQIGRTAQTLVGAVDEAGEVPRGPRSYVFFGARLVRGWAVQLVLVAALIPFFAAAVDLYARCRRRHVPLGPALRSYRSRAAFWLFVGAVFWVFAALGVWPKGAARPPAVRSDAVTEWPAGGLAGLAVIAAVGWLVARSRLAPRRRASSDELLAGHTAALLVLGVLALLVVATNAFALLFLLPSLHAWLWLPQVHDRPVWVRAGVLALGFAGPLLLLGSLATRAGLGTDAPWYLAELVALGYVPATALLLTLAWLAAAAQLTAITVGRYAPYPSAEERPPRGAVRSAVRAVLLPFVRRRRASQAARRALEA